MAEVYKGDGGKDAAHQQRVKEINARYINLDDTRCNMFGVLPCPKCGSKTRWPTQPTHPKHPDSIICDDCGEVTKK